MTSFVGNITTQPLISKDDERLLSDQWRQDVELADCGPAVGDYRSPWWPPGSGFYGDPALDVSMFPSADDSDGYRGWGDFDLTGGAQTRFGVIGVTRDSQGSPLASVTVKLYRTSTDEMVNSVVSDPSGNYVVYTPYYPDAHYLVTYKAGSPDVFGTSVNTLIGR